MWQFRLSWNTCRGVARFGRQPSVQLHGTNTWQTDAVHQLLPMPWVKKCGSCPRIFPPSLNSLTSCLISLHFKILERTPNFPAIVQLVERTSHVQRLCPCCSCLGLESQSGALCFMSLPLFPVVSSAKKYTLPQSSLLPWFSRVSP